MAGDTAFNVTAFNETATNLTAQIHDIHSWIQSDAANSADLWRITSSVFVFLMQLGFSLLEAGTVRFKNTRNIMIKNVLDTCVCAIAFWMFGYGIGFGEGNYFFGWKYENDGENALFGNAEGENAVQWFFQFTFAATSTTIIAGAVAERTHLWAYLFYNFFLSSLIYPVIAHLVWSDFGLLSPGRGAIILGTNGVLDNAGSMVVHVTGGVTSLIGAWMVGPRIGRYDIEGNPVPFKGHSMVYTAAGTIILWVGFFGFNGGSVNLINQDFDTWTYEVARICMNTTLSAAFSGMTVFVLTQRNKEPTPEDTFNAVIGGLVAACASSSLVDPYAAAIIGMGAGLWYLLGVWCLAKLKIDDVVQAAPTHLFCGTWGSLSVGFFATKPGIQKTYSIDNPTSYGCFYGGGAHLLGIQIVGLLVVYFWVGVTTFVLFYLLGFFGVLRVKRREEEVGLDVAFHGGEEGDVVEGRGMKERLSRKKNGGVLGFLRPRRRRKEGSTITDIYARGGYNRRDVWYKALETTNFGSFSLAMYEANYVMEDTGEVEASSSGVYIGVHDGHNGMDTAEYLKENLYENLKEQFVQQGGGISADSIRAAFAKTEATYTQLVREAFETNPQTATVGACSAACIITASAVWVANVGHCRVVLGQVRKTETGRECRALDLSVDHSLHVPSVREKYIKEHAREGGVEGDVVAEEEELVQERNGMYTIKGKIPVTRSFGDCYLKAHEFNREPLFARFRVAEPFHPPLVSSEPSIVVRLLSPHDAFLIVASDGLFKLISSQEAVDIVASSPKKDVARKLVRFALHRAAEKNQVRYTDIVRAPSGAARRAFHDDMTVVVFFFDHKARYSATRNNSWDPEGSVKGGRSVQEVIAESVSHAEDVALSQTKHGGIFPLLTPQLSLGDEITAADQKIEITTDGQSSRHVRRSGSGSSFSIV